MSHIITKDDLQWLLAEYYKLDKIEQYLRECVLLYYPTAEEYVKNEKPFKEEIATMLSREKQKLLQASGGHKGQHNKTSEQLLETELRRKINDEISALYRKIGKMIYGEDEYHKYKPKKTRSTTNTPNTPAIVSKESSSLTPIRYDDAIVDDAIVETLSQVQQEQALVDLNNVGEVSVNKSSFLNEIPDVIKKAFAEKKRYIHIFYLW